MPSEILLILRRIERHMIINVHRSSLKVLVIVVIQSDQKVSVHHYHNTRLSCLTTWLNLTSWQPTARVRGTLGLTLTLSVIPNSNYVNKVIKTI
jgi:hypothetical protein